MALSKTEHLGLNVFPQSDEGVILVRDAFRAIAEDADTSNMHIIDQAIYDLQTRQLAGVVWGKLQPEDQKPGDTWNEILEE